MKLRICRYTLQAIGYLSAIALVNVNQRTELPNKKWGYNVGLGLRFDISTGWNGKQTRF